jgi:hypothetical protein
MGAADERIRQEIASERQELALAVVSLHGQVQRAKRRVPKLVAGVVVAIVAVRVARRLLR